MAAEAAEEADERLDFIFIFQEKIEAAADAAVSHVTLAYMCLGPRVVERREKVSGGDGECDSG